MYEKLSIIATKKGSMLDSRTDSLIKKLNLLCASGGFCLLEEEELLLEGEDRESLRGMLAFLQDRGYLDVQYAENGEYCVRLLPEGRLYSERETREKLRERARQKGVFRAAMLGAFFGAILGGGAVFVLSLLL